LIEIKLEQEQDLDLENLFCLVNGFSQNNIAGMLQEFRYLPVVVLNYSEKPRAIGQNCFLLKGCDLLMLGEVVTYETCKVRMIYYKDF